MEGVSPCSTIREPMDDTNDAIADVLELLGTWQELQGAVAFKVMAYRNAAEELRSLDDPVVDWVKRGDDLTKNDAVGKGMAQRITEIAEKGALAYRESFEKEVGPGIFELLRIPGLGPKRVRQLMEKLDIRSPEALRDACLAGRLREAEGSGPRPNPTCCGARDARWAKNTPRTDHGARERPPVDYRRRHRHRSRPGRESRGRRCAGRPVRAA